MGHLADPFTPPHQPESITLVQRHAGLIFRKDTRLQGPDARRIRALAAHLSIPLSIDTMKAKVAARALAAGACIVNDVWGFQRDPDMARVVADHGAAAVLMHNRDTEDASLDIVEEVRNFLMRSMDLAQAARISLDRLILDPGIGFGKTPDQNMRLVREIGVFAALGCPVLLGASRKRIIGRITGKADPMRRAAGSVGATGAGEGASVTIVTSRALASAIGSPSAGSAKVLRSPRSPPATAMVSGATNP